uniref:Uncharacterized protein n=1 Tax=Arundo donax TaxID=35708 RepID=A0A0A9GW54_ARUDO
MPAPRRTRPTMSMATFMAAALMAPPRKKLAAPTMMLARRPRRLVTWEAPKVETRPAK